VIRTCEETSSIFEESDAEATAAIDTASFAGDASKAAAQILSNRGLAI